MKILQVLFARSSTVNCKYINRRKNVTKDYIFQFLTTANPTPTAAGITKNPSYLTPCITLLKYAFQVEMFTSGILFSNNVI
jgi:hypothetical protein